MTRDSIIGTLTLQRRLIPALLYRCAVVALALFGAVLCSLLGAALGAIWATVLVPGSTLEAAVSAGSAMGLLMALGIWRALRGAVLYFLRAGYLALVVALLDDAPVAPGRAQIGQAAGTVKARFGSALTLITLSSNVESVLRALVGLVQGVLAHVLPLPGLHRAARLQRAFLRRSLPTLDQVVLAHSLRQGVSNPWLAARHALVLHAQVARQILIRTARVTALCWAICAVLFVLLLPVGGALAQALPGDWAPAGVVYAGLLTWGIKVAVLEPLMLTVLIRASFALTDPLSPNPDWEDKLDETSAAFKTMGHRAMTVEVAVPPSARPPHGEAQGG